MARRIAKITPDDVFSRYAQLKRAWSKIHRNIRKNYRFLANDQWPGDAKAKLREQRRPASVYNLTLRLKDLYVGVNLAAPTMSQTIALEAIDDTISEKLNKWQYHWRARSHLQSQDNILLTDHFTAGVAVCETHIDYTRDPLGEVVTTRGNPLEYMYDLDSILPDQSDCRDMMRTEFITIREIADQYGTRIANRMDHLPEEKEIDSPENEPDFSDDPFETDDSSVTEADHDRELEEFMGMKHDGKVRRITWWRKEFVDQDYLYNQETGEVQAVGALTADEAINVAQWDTETTTILQRKRPVFRKVVALGDEIIENELHRDYYGFPWTFALGENLNGLIMSKVDSLKDPQMDFNKRESQKTHILGRMAKGVLMAWEDTLSNVDDAKRAINETGGVILLKGDGSNNAQRPHVVTEGSPPAALFTMSSESASVIQEISGIPKNLQGFMESSHESGVVVNQRIEQGMIGLQPYLENWRNFINSRAETAIWMFCVHESKHPMRAFNILLLDISTENVSFEDVVEAFQSTERLLNKSFSVVHENVGQTPTQRMAMTMQLLELMKLPNMQIPPEALLETMNIPSSLRKK